MANIFMMNEEIARGMVCFFHQKKHSYLIQILSPSNNLILVRGDSSNRGQLIWLGSNARLAPRVQTNGNGCSETEASFSLHSSPGSAFHSWVRNFTLRFKTNISGYETSYLGAKRVVRNRPPHFTISCQRKSRGGSGLIFLGLGSGSGFLLRAWAPSGLKNLLNKSGFLRLGFLRLM
jgi:hypothetical protein